MQNYGKQSYRGMRLSEESRAFHSNFSSQNVGTNKIRKRMPKYFEKIMENTLQDCTKEKF